MEFQLQQSQQISQQEFGARFKSKKECYRFLTVEGNAYLPHHQVITLYFIRDLISGKKNVGNVQFNLISLKFLQGYQVKHCSVPYYESISLEVMLDFAKQYPQSLTFLPDSKEQAKLPRQFVINVLNSTIKEPFWAFINEKIQFRNSRLLNEKKNFIEIKPSLLQAFNQSTYLSNQKGIGSSLLKSSIKRRRTRDEIEEEKQMGIIHQQEIEEKFAQNQQMQQRISEMENAVQKGSDAMDFIEQLIQRGIVHRDAEGNINAYQA